MGDTTLSVAIFCLTMNFEIIVLVYQITIISLLIEGSPQQSYEEFSPTMDGCTMRDEMSSMHNKKHITFIENTTDVLECAFHCKVDARCNFWSLHKDNEYCDLFGEEGDLREDINAISGTKDCGKATEKLCKNIESFMKDCQKNADEEHCRALSENFFMHSHCNMSPPPQASMDKIIKENRTNTLTTTKTTLTTQTTTTTK